MTKKVFYWLMMILILFVLNAATIAWLVYNFLPSQVPEISMWDISILKNQLQLSPSEYLSVGEKGAIYLFMVVGAISSAGFIKWLFKDTIQQVREKAKEKKDKAFKKFNKELD